MLTALIPHLRCPVCGAGLGAAGGSLRCPRGHSFDEARQGYVHLAAGPVTHPGDSAEMVEARARFLSAGHFGFLASALAGTAAPAGRLVVDVGAGTGYHLAAVLDAGPDALGLAVDVSKPALRRAARAHPRAGAVLADVWKGLPLADGCVDTLLNVFAPRNGPEFARVLAPGGALLVATPAAEHLTELVEALGLLRVDPAKQERVAASLTPHFVEQSSDIYRHPVHLSREEVTTLVGMGPSAWHTAPGALAAAVARLPEPVEVTAAVWVSRYSQVILRS